MFIFKDCESCVQVPSLENQGRQVQKFYYLVGTLPTHLSGSWTWAEHKQCLTVQQNSLKLLSMIAQLYSTATAELSEQILTFIQAKSGAHKSAKVWPYCTRFCFCCQIAPAGQHAINLQYPWQGNMVSHETLQKLRQSVSAYSCFLLRVLSVHAGC